jgi:vacuole morphology and inheritance protein 14
MVTYCRTVPAVASNATASRSKMTNKDDIRWQELAAHFRSVQAKHEKARRQASGGDMSAPFAEYPTLEEREAGNMSPPPGGQSGSRVTTTAGRRKTEGPAPISIPSRTGALSPLNPSRARTSGLLAGALGGRARPTSPNTNEFGKGKRAPSVGRKTG